MSHAGEAAVVVVGGDPDFCYLMRRYLREATHLRVVASSPGDALSLVSQERPVAIVLELDAPGPECWGTLRALKSDRATRPVPVVACSWLDAEQRSLQEGADRFLRKPVLYEDLVAALAGLGVRMAP
ncbi:MAG: response regulator [Anaerolineae bacterium]|nr:response regulator [Anaerolineae bacterium]